MQTFSHKLFLGLLLTCLALTAHAAETGLYSLVTVESDDGFVTQQPAISPSRLQSVMEDADRYLASQHASLATRVDKHRKAGNNYLLAAVMPGGLLYIAYHKGQQSSAESALHAIEQAQNELLQDEGRLQLHSTPVQIARFP